MKISYAILKIILRYFFFLYIFNDKWLTTFYGFALHNRSFVVSSHWRLMGFFKAFLYNSSWEIISVNFRFLKKKWKSFYSYSNLPSQTLRVLIDFRIWSTAMSRRDVTKNQRLKSRVFFGWIKWSIFIIQPINHNSYFYHS